MKSAIKIFLITLLTAVLTASALAAADTVEYSIDELGLSVELPDSMITFTQDIDPDDPNLALLGADEKILEDYYKTNNIYLDSVSTDLSYEIYITVLHDSSSEALGDIKDYTVSEIEEGKDLFAGSFASAGFNSVSSEVYDQGQTKFIKLNFNRLFNGKQQYGLVYCTVVDGSNIFIYAYDYIDEISSEQDAYIKDIIDSISFAKYETNIIPASPPVTSETTPKTYYDTKVMFTVPAGWAKDKIDIADEIYKTKYKSSAGDIIMYGCMNLTNNKDSLNMDEVKALLEEAGLDVSEVTNATINELEYYKVTGEALGVVFINHITIIDRVMYFFNFYSSVTDNVEASEGYQDYVKLLSSISFMDQSSQDLPSNHTPANNVSPSVYSSPGELPPNHTPANNVSPDVYSPPGESGTTVSKINPLSFALGAIILVVVAITTLVISLIVRSKAKAAATAAAYRMNAAAGATHDCPHCGKPLPHGGCRFCPACGNDISTGIYR